MINHLDSYCWRRAKMLCRCLASSRRLWTAGSNDRRLLAAGMS